MIPMVAGAWRSWQSDSAIASQAKILKALQISKSICASASADREFDRHHCSGYYKIFQMPRPANSESEANNKLPRVARCMGCFQCLTRSAQGAFPVSMGYCSGKAESTEFCTE